MVIAEQLRRGGVRVRLPITGHEKCAAERKRAAWTAHETKRLRAEDTNLPLLTGLSAIRRAIDKALGIARDMSALAVDDECRAVCATLGESLIALGGMTANARQEAISATEAGLPLMLECPEPPARARRKAS